MDRRQGKTRAAIFEAFARLLARRPYERITVREIIDEANVGRSTFYAHFETREALLAAMCERLFRHIIDSARDARHTHGAPPGAEPPSVFRHILEHLQENDGSILSLLSCESSDIFLRYFKDELSGLVRAMIADRGGVAGVPDDFLAGHIAGAFVDAARWWIAGGMAVTPAELDGYFRAVIPISL